MNASLRLIPAGALLALIAATAPADAQTVLIDFGTDASFRGLSVVNPATNGNNGNNIAPARSTRT